jgi:hypothetical protein
MKTHYRKIEDNIAKLRFYSNLAKVKERLQCVKKESLQGLLLTGALWDRESVFNS